ELAGQVWLMPAAGKLGNRIGFHSALLRPVAILPWFFVLAVISCAEQAQPHADGWYMGEDGHCTGDGQAVASEKSIRKYRTPQRPASHTVWKPTDERARGGLDYDSRGVPYCHHLPDPLHVPTWEMY